jgi:hypothetical protein
MGRLLDDLRQDPRHAAEIGLLYTFAVLKPRLEVNSAALKEQRADLPSGHVGMSVAKRSISRARLDGAMTGTSFLLATPLGLLSIWLNQVTLVVGIAASAGLDPADPLRVAEFLVVSGLYDTVDEAASVLSAIPYPREVSAKRGLWTAVAGLAAQVPALLGLGIRRVRSMGIREAVTLAAMGIGCILPIVGVPVFAFSSGRETRSLGLKAVQFYSAPAQTPPPVLAVDVEGGNSKRARRLLGTVTLAALAGVVLASWHWLGARRGVGPHVALAVLWVWVLLTCANLAVTVRRAGRPQGSSRRPLSAPATTTQTTEPTMRLSD